VYAALVSGGAADEAVAMAWLQLWRAQEWQRQVGARPPGHWLCAGALLRKRLFLAIERSMFGARTGLSVDDQKMCWRVSYEMR